MIGIQETNMMEPPSSTTIQGSGTTTLPSGLYGEYDKMSNSGEELDYGSLVQNVLSSLAVQQDLFNGWDVEQSKGEMAKWINSALQTSVEKDEQGIPTTEDYEPGTIVYEWWVGMQLVARLLPHLSPFEIHNVATQSSVFAEGSHSHWILCMILCSIAMAKCPAPLEQRWKRWQSLVCETIRLFQNHELVLGSSAVPLWTDHVLPACQHVIRQLPSEALHAALLSGLVGTTSTIILEECYKTENVWGSEMRVKGLHLLEAVRTVAQQADKDIDEWIFSNPWKSRTKTFEDSGDEDETFEKNKDNVVWWSSQASHHEKVAGMDTKWNETGIAIIAMLGFEARSLTYTPEFIWRTWFPHVSILFKAAHHHPCLEDLPTKLLEKLFEVVPKSHSQPSAPRPTKLMLHMRFFGYCRTESYSNQTRNTARNRRRLSSIPRHRRQLLVI